MLIRIILQQFQLVCDAQQKNSLLKQKGKKIIMLLKSEWNKLVYVLTHMDSISELQSNLHVWPPTKSKPYGWNLL